jgi:hypothetical protein
MALGFDVNIGGSSAGQPGSYLGTKNYSSGPGEGAFRDVPGLAAYHGTDTFLTEALTREANRAIDDAVARQRPFFLHFAHYAVHTPLEADARFLQKYLDAGLPPVEARYASLIEGVDQSLGDVLANVERHGLTRNTLVIFLSDNGGLSAHTRAAPLHEHNAPLRSGKGSAYEGGIRVPLLVKWPGTVPAGAVRNEPTITDDLFPTLLDVAGVPNASAHTRGLLGRDLRRVLSSASMPADRRLASRPLLWHYPHFWGVNGPGIEPFSALRVGRHPHGHAAPARPAPRGAASCGATRGRRADAHRCRDEAAGGGAGVVSGGRAYRGEAASAGPVGPWRVDQLPYMVPYANNQDYRLCRRGGLPHAAGARRGR